MQSIDYAKPITEAAIQFHLGAALAIMSMGVGRRAYVQWGDKEIYPNLFVCLIGQSTFSRKSTSSDIQEKILRTLDPELIFPRQYSSESMLSCLEKHPESIFFIDEFGGFLKSCEDKSYMSGTIELLTELYKCPEYWPRELNSRKYELRNVFISILACSTIDWLTKNIKESDIKGGFFPRFLFFVSETIGSPLPRPPAPDLHLRNEMIDSLRRVGSINGIMSIEPAACARYDAYYVQNFEEARNATDPLLTGSYGRMADDVIKIAMLYELSAKDGNSRIISEDSINRAIRLIKYLRESLRNLIRNELSFTPEMDRQKRILYLINKRPGITRSELLRHSHLSAEWFERTIMTLIQAEQIQKRQNVIEKRKAPNQYYPFNYTFEDEEVL